MHFTCRSFIGNGHSSRYSQTWENEPDDPSLVSARGHLFGLISINTPKRQIIDQINAIYFSSRESSIPIQLSSTLSQIITDPEVPSDQSNLLLTVVSDYQAHFCFYGSSVCYLVRPPEFSQIVTGRAGQIISISGPLRPKDRLFIANQNFISSLGPNIIKPLLFNPSIQVIEENLLSSLYSLPDQTNLCAFLIEVNPDDSDQITSEPPAASLPQSPKSTFFPPTSPKFHFPFLSPRPSPRPSPSSDLAPPLKKIKQHLLFQDSKNSDRQVGDEAINNRAKLDKSGTQNPDRKIVGFLPRFLTRFSPPPKDIFVSPHELTAISKRKKFNLFSAILILIGLTVISVAGYRKNQSFQLENRYRQLKTQLETQLADAQKASDINFDSALDFSHKAQSTLDQMVALKTHSDEVSQYQSQLTSLLVKTGAPDTFTPESFYDTSLIANSPKYQKIIFSSGNLILFDPVVGRLDNLDVVKKSVKNLAQNDNAKIFSKIAQNNNQTYLYDANNLVVVSKTRLDPVVKFTDLDPLDLDFWNGSFYLLDKAGSSIVKFTPTADTFAGLPWLKENQKLPDNPTSLAINGRIWVLSQNGRITPYNRGVKDTFTSSQPVSVKSASNLLVGNDLDRLIFLDSPNTIYVFQKDGQLLSRFNLGKLEILSLALDEKNQQLFLLSSDQKIYQISL